MSVHTQDAPKTGPAHTDVKTVGIVGFGAMGSGIAHVCALAGFPVVAVEPFAETAQKNLAQISKYLDRGVDKGRLTADQRDQTLQNITTTADLADLADADLVIEAVTENIDIKRDLFAKLEAICGEQTVLATNTSSLSVTEIAAASQHPERVVGMHFFNPAPVLPLVEVIRGERSSDEAFNRAFAFTEAIGKVPIRCADTPGFVVNRILIPLMNDVARVYESGIASAEDIDKGCKYGLNWPIGPLALLDLVGLDVHVHASEGMYEAYREARFAPPPILQRMLKAGKLGRKSGEGFYRYE